MWLCRYVEFNVLAASKFILGLTPTGHSEHSWLCYSGTSVGNKATSSMTRYLTQLIYASTELIPI